MSAWRVIRASAPTRLDFAGGWTDVPPFSDREGGAVVNLAIGLQVSATIEPAGRSIVLISEDLGQRIEAASSDALTLDGRLNLLAAAVRRHGPRAGRVTTRSETPAGSGLGSSGALGVALVAACARAGEEALSSVDIAERAYRMESEDAHHPGGRQDQYAAALGGCHHLTFEGDKVTATPLLLDAAFRDELARRAVLCYTGSSRISGTTIARVMAGYTRNEPAIRKALFIIRDAAELMLGALRSSDLGAVGRTLSANWIAQQALDPGMRTESMARLEEAMTVAGTLGGKAVGAGAGGSMLFLAKDDPAELARVARSVGATVLPVAWADRGVVVEG